MRAPTNPGPGTLGGLAGALLAATAASGQFTSEVTSETVYWFKIHGVPDLDQRRGDLVNGGTAYCVPTTAINWLGYLTNHGAPVLATGPANWEAQSNYDLATFMIASMGSPTYMDTHPQDGTDVLDGVTGLQAWLGDGWVVSYWLRDKDWSPGFEILRATGMNGALILGGVGWYLPGGDPCPIRIGGHVFAVCGIERNVSARWIDIRDPATDEEPITDPDVQSAFTTERYHAYPEFFNPNCFDPQSQSRLAYRLVGLTRDHNEYEAWAYLDYVRSIFPQLVATVTGSGELTYLMREYSGGLPPVRSYAAPDDGSIVDAALTADLGGCFAVVAADGLAALWAHAPGASTWTPVEVGANEPSDVATGRHREAYVLSDDGTRVICFDADTFEVEADVNLPGQAHDLVYDDVADELVVLSLSEHAIFRYAYGLEDPPLIQFPDEIPFAEDASMAWDPSDGALWWIVAGDASVYRLPAGAGAGSVEVVELPGLVAPVAIDVGDGGRLFVSDQGVIMEYVPDGGGYAYPPDPALPQGPAGHVVTAARSRTNYEPGLVDDDWHQLLPTTVADGVTDCHADVDASGMVDIDDLVAVILAWGTNDPFADVNNDGVVGVDDLVDVILAWGPCAAG